MKRIAVLASGEGTNLEAILEAVESGEIDGRVELVISDRGEAPALQRARRRSVRALHLDPRLHRGREEYDGAVAAVLQQSEIDLVVLAGFMRLISPLLVRAFPMQIMNIHPSLLPSFPGTSGVKEALDYGVKVTGCTVHFVDEGLDTGPIIMQETVPVLQKDTVETLHGRIHAVEYRLYPRAIQLFCLDMIKVEGRRCFIG